jgi:uncharacterized protein DUF1588/uncharacterized protein DUF1592/uncharacterized protein DUF1595/uncharacterized protein DUF1587/uncharacterized protein DUF1585
VEPRIRGVAPCKRGVGLFFGAWGVLAGVVACSHEVSAPPPNRSAPAPTAGVPDAGAPPTSVPDTGAPPVTGTCAPSTSSRVRRLSQDEYRRAVQALVGIEPPILSWSAPDPLVHGFDNNAEALAISPGTLEDFALAAELTAASVDPAALAPCGSDELGACAERFVASFAERAFGRPPSHEELERLQAQYRLGAASEDHARGVRLVVETVLVSPHFLYRIEIGSAPHDRPAERELDAAETANALAFALTGARPDAALAARARSDPEFATPRVLREEAQRLVRTREAGDHLARFVRGWLGLPDLRQVNKIPILFPEFTPSLKADLEREVALFLEHAFGPGGGTLDALFGAPLGFANEALLTHVYAADALAGASLPAPVPGTFQAVAFDPSLRRGVLSLAGWLAAHSPVHRSSPVDRGLTIRTRLFCQSLSPPPPDAVTAAPGPGDTAATTRQKFEQHVADSSCSGCHAMIDPIGFGLEMMDALGRYRETENGLPVDSSGSLFETDVDGAFRGPAELSEKLLESAEVRACVVRQLFRFVEGRDATPADGCRLEPLVAFFSTRERSLGDLAVELATQRAFVTRSVEP